MKHLSTLILALFISFSYAISQTHHVNPDGICGGLLPCYNTIQGAIDAASAGDTVCVADGTYNLTQPINIDKAIVLRGNVSNPADVLVNGASSPLHPLTGNKACFLVSSSDVTIEGFHLQGATDVFQSPYNTAGTYQQNWAIFIGFRYNAPALGTYYNNIDNVSINDNIISSSSCGIHLYNNNYVQIKDNVIRDILLGFGEPVYSGGVGIVVYNTVDDLTTGNYTIQGNKVYNCEFAGIVLNVSNTGSWVDLNGSNIINNDIYNNISDLGNWGGSYAGLQGGFGIRGWNKIQGLAIEGNSIYGHTSVDDSYPYIGGIRINGTKDLLIKNNTIHNNERGIYLGGGGSIIDSPTIIENEIYDNDHGIYIGNGTQSQVAINQNKITNNSTSGVQHDNTNGPVDATFNWWGDATGPFHDSTNTCGLGNGVSDYVSFSPWYKNANLDTTVSLPVHNITQNIHYCKIQDAIDNANVNDVIEVGDGTYHEEIEIDVSGLTLKNSSSPVIDGGGALIAVTILADDVTFSGFTVQNASGMAAIALLAANNCRVYDNLVRDCSVGIAIMDSSNNNSIDSNTVENLLMYGIVVDYLLSPSNTSENNSLLGNSIYGSQIGIYLGESASKTEVIENIIHDNFRGIELFASDSNIFKGNEIYNNLNRGIALVGSQKNLFTDANIITGGVNQPDGFVLTTGATGAAAGRHSSGNIIQGNNISGHPGYGVHSTGHPDNGADATHNWWGDPTGPGGSGPGTGNAISDNVTYCLWYDDEVSTGSLFGPVHNTTQDIFYCDIQDAIDNAYTHDAIHVSGGPYHLNNSVLIDKPLSLIGVSGSKSYVVVNAPTAGGTQHSQNSAFVILADSVTISGFKVQGAYHTGTAQNAAIYVDDPRFLANPGLTGILISHNEITDNGYGIVMQNTRNSRITKNIVHTTKKFIGKETESGVGIVLFGRSEDNTTHNILIDSNEVYSNETEGIRIDVSSDSNSAHWVNDLKITIKQNIIFENGSLIGGEDKYIGIKSAGWSMGVNIDSNEIYGHKGTSITTNSRNAAIVIFPSKDYSITRNFLHSNLNGIIFGFSTFDPGSGFHGISNNDISDNIRGISIDDGSEAIANGNNIYNNNSLEFILVPYMSYGILNTSTTDLDATLNWWGDASGPAGAGPGTGDSVSSYVDYCPWLGTSQPGGQTYTVVLDDTPDPAVCVGENITLFVIPSEDPGLTYQWYHNGDTLLGETDSVLMLTHVDLSDAGDYVCLAKYECYTFSNDTIKLTVDTIPIVSLNLPLERICNYKPGLKLSGGLPLGGSYSGSGVFMNNFYPALISPGTYTITYTFTSAGHCPSSATDQIIVDTIPVVTLATMPDFCENAGSYTLFEGSPAGGTYTGSYISGGVFNVDSAGPGTYTVTYTWIDGNSCQESASGQLEVHPLPAVSIAAPFEICAEQSPVTLIGGNPTGGTWSGTGVKAGLFHPTTLLPGNYTMTYSFQDTNGCSNFDTTTMTIHPLPVASAGANEEICLGNCAALAAAGGGNYQWSNGANTSSFNACPSVTTTYTVTVTDHNGCQSTDDVMVTVRPLPAEVHMVETICSGECIILTAPQDTSYTYVWSNGSVQPTLQVCPTDTTAYFVDVSNEFYCQKRSTYIVNVKSLPLVNAGLDANICLGDSTDLTATGAISYEWNTTETSAIITVSPSAQTTYTVTGTGSNGCSATDDVVVLVHSLPIPVIAPASPEVCAGDCIEITASGGISYAWDHGPLQAMVEVCPVTTTTYTVSATDHNACVGTAEVSITAHPLPQVYAGPDTSIYIGFSYTFNKATASGTPPLLYSWSPGLSLDNTGILAPTSSPIASTTFSLLVSDGNGCTFSDDFALTVLPTGNTLSGQIVYDNDVKTPLPGFEVIITALGSKYSDTVQAGINGFFFLENIPGGTYAISGTSSQSWGWGGVNSTDALFSMKHFVQLDTLAGIRLAAGDVTTEGGINTTDALRIAQRFSGVIDSFAAGNWVMEQDTVSFTVETFYTRTFLALCVGDVNGSYTPFKQAPRGQLLHNDILNMNPGVITEIPVKVKVSVPFGAVSLQLAIPEGLDIVAIRKAENMGGIMSYGIKNQELRLAWYDVAGANLQDEAIAFYIQAKPKPMTTLLNFRAAEVIEIADVQGHVIKDAAIDIPSLRLSPESAMALHAYPNPLLTELKIEYLLPHDGQIKMEIIDMLGSRLDFLYDGFQTKGSHSILWNGSELSPGTYFLRLSCQNDESPFQESIRFIKIK